MTPESKHHAGKNGEHSYGENWHNTTKNGENSDCNSNLVTKDLMHHTGRNGENLHEDDLYKHNVNKHSCVHLSLHQVSKICEYLTKRHTKSDQHMERPNTFTNYVKTTLNYGSSIMEVDWGGNPDPNDTLSACMLKEVDWGAHETHQN